MDRPPGQEGEADDAGFNCQCGLECDTQEELDLHLPWCQGQADGPPGEGDGGVQLPAAAVVASPLEVTFGYVDGS